MNKLAPYLLLTALCINLFGASVGELMHMAAHLTEGTHRQWHTHQHEQVTPLARVTDHHLYSHHTHHKAINFLLEAFDTSHSNTPLKDLLHLNLLMLVIDGIINDNSFHLGIPIARQHVLDTSTTILKTAQPDTPTPPPRFLVAKAHA